jgi:hypothetical protein
MARVVGFNGIDGIMCGATSTDLYRIDRCPGTLIEARLLREAAGILNWLHSLNRSADIERALRW